MAYTVPHAADVAYHKLLPVRSRLRFALVMLPAMNPSEPKQIENDSRHPVDFLEPFPNSNKSPRRTCEVFSCTFVWIADGSALEQVGLCATVVLYYVRPDLIGRRKPRRNRSVGRLYPASCRTSCDGLPLHPRLGMNTATGRQHRDRKVEA